MMTGRNSSTTRPSASAVPWRAVVVALSVCAALGTCSGHAETMTWDNTAGGDWHSAVNWDPQNVPNSSGESALIPDDGNTYTIVLGSNTNVDGIELLNPLATLNLADGDLSFYQSTGLQNHGTVQVDLGNSKLTGNCGNAAGGVFNLLDATSFTLDGGVFTNDGVLAFNPLLGPNGTVITVRSGGQILGTGELLLQRDGLGSVARLETYYTTLTHGADHTIRGGGRITASIDNYGLIRADRPGDPLELSTGNRMNYDTIEAVAGAELHIGSGRTSQDPAGVLQADGGVVVVESSAEIHGGSFASSAGGHIEITGENSQLHNITNGGEIRISGPAQTNVYGSLTNDGDFRINYAQDDEPTRMRFVGGAVTLGGYGTIHLQTNGDRDDAYLSSYYTTATHESAHTIRGGGCIYAGIVNHGTIRADRAGDPLHLDDRQKTNAGLMVASDGGELIIGDGDISQEPAGIIRADGGVVTFGPSAEIIGGRTESANGGHIQVQNDNVEIRELTNAGDLHILGLAKANIQTALANDGDVRINPSGEEDDATLRFYGGTVALNGTGTIHMQTGGDPSDARITSYYTNTTQGPEHTVRGGGRLAAAVINEGTIRADRPGDPLWLDTFEKTNDGLMEARDGGELLITGIEVHQGETGVFRADGGTVALETGAEIEGGTLATANGGIVQTRIDGSWRNLTNAGDAEVLAGAMLTLHGEIHNDGRIVMNPDQEPAVARLRTWGGTVHLRGGGEVVLNADADPGHAVFSEHYTNTMHHEEHTIRGHGRIEGSLVNYGAVIADRAHGLIDITTANFRNEGLAAAQDGATLRVADPIHQNYNSGRLSLGRWHVYEGSTMRLLGANISAVNAEVMLCGADSWIYSDDGATDALAGLAQVDPDGHFSIQDGRDFACAGALHNQGRVTVGAGCTLTTDGAYTQTGSNPPSHQFDGQGWTEINGVLQRIAAAPLEIDGGTLLGGGLIEASVVSSGRVDPGSSAGELTINGDYAQEAEGVLFVEMAGRQPGEYDHLQVNGHADLAGIIWIREIDGFSPVAGDVFRVLSCASRAGEFDLHYGAAGVGLQYEVLYYDDHVDIAFYEDFSGVAQPEIGGGDPTPPEVIEIPAALSFAAHPRASGADLLLALPQPASIEIRIYDPAGREVARIPQQASSAGRHVFHWDGSAASGGDVGSGVYFARALVRDERTTQVRRSRILVLR